MTKFAFAKHRGVSPAMVTKWKDAGRLVLRGDRVDVAASDALIDALQDRSRSPRPLAAGATPAGFSVLGAATNGGGSGSPGSPPAGIPAEASAMVAATVAAKQASADWNRARIDRELGKLVDRGAFEDACEQVFAIAREAFRNLAPRIGGAIAERLQVDARRVFPIVEDEAERIVHELADAVVGLAERAEQSGG